MERGDSRSDTWAAEASEATTVGPSDAEAAALAPPDLDLKLDEYVPPHADPSEIGDAPPETTRLENVNDLSEIERQSVTESVNGFMEFAERRLLSLAADHLLPGLGGRLVELAFELKDVVMSVRALGSDDPVLEAPLPSPAPGLDFTLEIPLSSGKEAHSTPPLALCIAPDASSFTGGWAMDSPEQNGHPDCGHETGHSPERLSDAEEEELELELDQRKATSPRRETTGMDGQRQFMAENRPATGFVVEIDLGRLPLLRRRKLRALELYALALEYAPYFRENLRSQRFDVLVIADPQRRYGLWISLGSDLDGDTARVTSREIQPDSVNLR